MSAIFRRRDFVLYRVPVWRQQVRKFLCRLLDRAKFHGNVKPIQDPIQRPLGSIDGFLKFACAVRDDRDFLIIRDTLLREKMIESGRGRRDLPIDVSINFATAVVANRTAGDDVHVPPGRRWALRRVILRELGFILFFARRPVAQPCGIHRKSDNLDVAIGRRIVSFTANRAFDVIVEFLADRPYAIPQS